MALLRCIVDYKQAGMPLEEIKEIVGEIAQHACMLNAVRSPSNPFWNVWHFCASIGND